METIASGIIVLCMFYQGGIIEHTYTGSKDVIMFEGKKTGRKIC